MERRRFISDCVTKAAEELGSPTMKQEQLDVAIAFVEGRDVFMKAFHTTTTSLTSSSPLVVQRYVSKYPCSYMYSNEGSV